MLPRITHAVGLVVAFAATRPALAEVVSLDEVTFLKKLHDRSPRRQALAERARAAGAAVDAAAVLPNPTLSYEREAVPGLDATDDSVRLGWTIDLAGRRGLARDAARAGAQAERLETDREAHVLEIDARLAYLDAMHARERAARLAEARTALAELVAALASRAKQGDASSYDADRATLELDALDDERATANRELEAARLRLGALAGEPGIRYDAADRLVLPAKPGALATPLRADVDAALARATRAEREARAAGRKWFPRIELVGGVMRTSTAGSDGVGYVVGIGGDLPLFDRGTRAEAQARAEAKRWRVEASALANDARGEAVQAREDLALRIAQAEAYLAGPAKRATELQLRAAVVYREGDRPILELLDVQRAARHAAVRAIELVYEARRAELVLRRALGRIP